VEANRRAVELKPNQAAAHGNLGFVLFHLGRWDDALSSLKRSVELDPTNPIGLAEGIGPISAALGDRVSAEAAWRKALELQPESPSVPRFRIAVFFYYGRPGEALSAARGAPQASTDPALTQQIALAEVVAGDLQRGRELLERALPALRDQRRPQLATAGAAETNLAAVY